MKKYVMFLLLPMTLVLGACSNTENTNSEPSTHAGSSQKQDTPTQNKTDETVSQKNQEQTKDVPDLFDIQLNTKSKKVELLSPGGKPVVLADNIPSKPVKSPNGEKAAYISPSGWEELSNLYIVDLHDGSQHELVHYDPENKPKDVIWEDDKHVLVIIGYPYGAITVGGNIYKINVETNEKEAVTDYDSNTQITDLLDIKDGVLHYSGIQYTDKEQNERKKFSDQMKLDHNQKNISGSAYTLTNEDADVMLASLEQVNSYFSNTTNHNLSFSVKKEKDTYVGYFMDDTTNEELEKPKLVLSLDGKKLEYINETGESQFLSTNQPLEILKGYKHIKSKLGTEFLNHKNRFLVFDHMEEHKYVYHIFDSLEDHDATYDWVEFDPVKNTYISQLLPNNKKYD
ncbi:hypothetical protein BIV60_16320 [Bacillus sp. MUM 116]|uniref:DUF4652 domain-containing protein n=1 Tax=Bacillus sp. MUM 116 TaxID=1678002 RepID=UPI0008F5EFE0|nr:DUF4652 domain-containing protein [Bacillus sp. MUM 116]OIK12462.1 hypothetical protein BIV60_16320 [Bacillus sp. MUM 116]